MKRLDLFTAALVVVIGMGVTGNALQEGNDGVAPAAKSQQTLSLDGLKITIPVLAPEERKPLDAILTIENTQGKGVEKKLELEIYRINARMESRVPSFPILVRKENIQVKLEKEGKEVKTIRLADAWEKSQPTRYQIRITGDEGGASRNLTVFVDSTMVHQIVNLALTK